MQKNKISKIIVISLHLMCGVSFGASLNYVTNRAQKYLLPNKPNKEQQIVSLIDTFLNDKSILDLKKVCPDNDIKPVKELLATIISEHRIIDHIGTFLIDPALSNQVFTDKAIRAKYHDSVEKLQVLLSEVDKIIIKDGIIDRFINRNLDEYEVRLKAFLQLSKNEELLAAYKALSLAKQCCGADLENKKNPVIVPRNTQNNLSVIKNQISGIQFFNPDNKKVKCYGQDRQMCYDADRKIWRYQYPCTVSMNIFKALEQLKAGLSCDQTS